MALSPEPGAQGKPDRYQQPLSLSPLLGRDLQPRHVIEGHERPGVGA